MASARTAPWGSLLVLWLLVAVFCVQAYSQRWYNDDTFITFRYSRNLVEGAGIAWNTVDSVPVEGSTSLGWMLLMALGIALGLDPVNFSHGLGLLAGAVAMVVVWRAARDLLGLSPTRALAAPLVLFLGRQWLVWAVAGLETRAATVLVLLATVRFVQEREDPGRRTWISGVLFFLATVFRPEVPLLHLAAGAGLALARRSKAALGGIVISGLVHGVLLAVLCGWRLALFGKPLPNTFYAKVGGIQLSLGLTYVWQFLLQNFAWIWLPLIFAGLWWARHRLPLLVAALLAEVLFWTAWIAVEGGGAWEFRFFDVCLPALALLAVFALDRLAPPQGARRRLFAVGALVVAAAFALPTFLPFKEFFPTVSWRSLKRSADEMLREGRLLAPYLGSRDRICIGWAGALPWVTGAWHFDPFGLNDPEIATRPFQKQGVLFHQRHATWDDVVARRVMFCDIFNQFLYDRPYAPNQVPRSLMPWARDGVMVHCLELPTDARWRFWIFASPAPVSEVRAWARKKGLKVHYSAPLIVSRPGARR